MNSTSNIPSLDKETRRPRLRTASMLFGVVAASTSAGAATHYALCDREGAPACGNIGQLGRNAPPTQSARIETTPIAEVAPQVAEAPPPITNTTVTHNAPLVQITITNRFVMQPGAPATRPVDPLTTDFVIDPLPAKALTDQGGDFAAGNVMTKGGPRRRH